jgi:PAS domain S-box-containing protein
MIAGLIIPASVVYYAREKGITQVARQIQAISIEFLKDNKAARDFLAVESANPVFFSKGQSPYLTFHQQASERIGHDLMTLMQSRHIRSLAIEGKLSQLAQQIGHFNSTFDSLIYLVYKRGYRNYGLEGELSNYMSLLEQAPGMSSRDIYSLRTIENSYFLKNDTSALLHLSEIIQEVKHDVNNIPSLEEKARKQTLDLITGYFEAFTRLQDIDQQAGIGKNLALSASLDERSQRIEMMLSALFEDAGIKQKSLLNRLNTYYALSLIMIFCIALIFSLVLSKYMVGHLETLTSYITVLAKNQKQTGPSINLKNSAREIKQIYSEFRGLVSQLTLWKRQRDRALKNAEDNQQNYRELTDMLPQSVFETDFMGNYTYVNKAWYKAFGYAPEDLQQGLNLIETLVSDSDPDKILGHQKIENSQFYAKRKDGKGFPASVYSDSILRDGKVAGRRGIIIDITDKVDYIRTLQKETHKARSADELKSSFLANMSHEIRTPMNSIIGFSNLLASDQIPENQKRDFTHYIQSSSELLLNLVDDIIDIAKIEAGELKIVKKDCELMALGQEILLTAKETCKKLNKQHLQIIFNPDPCTDALYVKSDPFRLKQILVNLVNNAVKFTDKGSVELGYRIKEESLIEFFVKDTGVGLSREEVSMIFERFKRARLSEEKNIVGAGLGLAISKNLVQLLGGEMWVDSIAGAGTTFLFTLPYLKPTVLPSERHDHYLHGNTLNWSGKTILIAEDDSVSYKFLFELLKSTQVDLLHAPNGKIALDMLQSAGSKIDLVIMDIQMPEMDGISATQQIKKINPRIPVIAQTAYAMAGDKERMQMAGCDDYIAKPIDSNQFLALINHYLFVGLPLRAETRIFQNS